MSFYALDFVFNGVSSRSYGLTIISNNSGVDEYTLLRQKLETNKSLNATKSFILDLKDDVNTEFELYMKSENPLTTHEINRISDWLCPQDTQYKKLFILQDDMLDYHYNCKIKRIDITTYGNIPYVLKCTIECDSQFVWSNIKTKTFNITSLPYVCNLQNPSYEKETKPIYKIKCDSADGTIKIVNNTLDKYMELTNLSKDEIITIDTNILSITSSLEILRLGDFNKVFLPLARGTNKFTITGNISTFEIQYQLAKRYGG